MKAMILASLLALVALAGQESPAPASGAPADPGQTGAAGTGTGDDGMEGGMDAVRARVQALVAAPANRLAPFRSTLAPGEDPRPGVQRAVPALRATTPWSSDEFLWLQVPEHVWTHLPAAPEERRPLFSGEDPRRLLEHWGRTPFPPLTSPAWGPLEGGGMTYTCALEGGPRVSFEVRPGDRLLELRFRLANEGSEPLLDTWPQFCTALPDLGSLAASDPASLRVRVGGALVGWDAFGQDLSALERFRDPSSGRLVRGFSLLGLVEGCADERFPPGDPREPDRIRLARTLDLPLLVKSSADGRRHLVLYSPNGRSVMSNLFSPCMHVDPHLERVGPGEDLSGVLFVLFFEGEVEDLVAALAAADPELRRPRGFGGG